MHPAVAARALGPSREQSSWPAVREAAGFGALVRESGAQLPRTKYRALREYPTFEAVVREHIPSRASYYLLCPLFFEALPLPRGA